MRGPKAESSAQAQAGMMQSQGSMWAGDKKASGDGKAAKEAVWVTKGVCIPQGKRTYSSKGIEGGLGAGLWHTSRLCNSTWASCPSAGRWGHTSTSWPLAPKHTAMCGSKNLSGTTGARLDTKGPPATTHRPP